MTETSLEIYSYSIEELLEIFAAKSKANTEQIKNKIHLTYFREYFKNLNAKTILVENEYVDKDFSSILRELFREDIFETALKSTTAWKIIQWFRESTVPVL